MGCLWQSSLRTCLRSSIKLRYAVERVKGAKHSHWEVNCCLVLRGLTMATITPPRPHPSPLQAVSVKLDGSSPRIYLPASALSYYSFGAAPAHTSGVLVFLWIAWKSLDSDLKPDCGVKWTRLGCSPVSIGRCGDVAITSEELSAP